MNPDLANSWAAGAYYAVAITLALASALCWVIVVRRLVR